MPLKRSRPLDDLYRAVSEYDLVIVPDSPLADALNRRIDRPHFGPFAITPRRFATRRREAAEDRTAFLDVIRATELRWKQVSRSVGDILQCWEYRGRPDAIFEYDGFDTPATRTVLDAMESVDTSSQILTDVQIEDDDAVAVVGERQLTALERSILPDTYDAIERFVDEPFELPPFRIFDSPSAIVDALLDSITASNADDVAIVLDGGSEYSPLVESALETAAIPYYGGPGFMDRTHHRAFVQLLRFLTGGSDTRVRVVKPLLAALGEEISVAHDEKRLVDVVASELEWMEPLLEADATLSVSSALSTYETRADTELDALREELSRVGVLDEPVTAELVDRLTYYFDTYEVPIDRENEGVLLADATSASFVDRPLVFFLGLDEDWTHTSPNRPWVDREAEFDRNVDGFQSLIQSGVERHYLVQDSANGSSVTPCLYFEELLDAEFERFSDLDSVRHARPSRTVETGFEREPLDASIAFEPVESVSQSSLNAYANSPRDYFFGRIVDSPDTHYFAEGNLFHDFAEFAANHPSIVEEHPLEAVVDAVIAEVRPFHRSVDIPTRRTRYRIGLETILEFLAEHAPTDTSFVTPASGWGDNFFAEYFDTPVDSPVTERWFDDAELGLKGKIDLLASPTTLVDYKSGRRKRASRVTRASSVADPSDTPNFQALLYLTYWRKRRPNETHQFTFFHFLETLDDAITGDAELDDCLTTVTYRPTTFAEFVRSPDVFEELQQEAPNDCTKTFSKVEYAAYREVVDAHSVPRTRDADALIASSFGEALRTRMVAEVGDYKYVTNGCKQACRHLCEYRTNGYFADDLDEFERFVDEQIAALNRYRRGEDRFPVNGRAGEPNYRYVDHRDLLLTEERPRSRAAAGSTRAAEDPAASAGEDPASPAAEDPASPAAEHGSERDR
ncbi:PD-(D/E)XK nuclease family protein [Halorubrum sp. DTA46]|uniref:PD-(D/E)XK nuclease family protein n=1 Tax=Halorubrum sp. DTA46 TaxID=3402162 RepID=UPI003AAAE23D